MLIDTERGVNIKELTIEEPKSRSLDLDLTELLTDEDWEDISQYFDNMHPEDILARLNLAARVRLIAPQKLSMFHTPLDQVQAELNRYKGRINYKDYLYAAAAAKQLYGKEALNLDIDAADKNNITSLLKTDRESDSKVDFKIIFPEVPTNQYTKEGDWQRLKTQIQANKNRYWYWATVYSAIARLLFPTRFPEANITSYDLIKMYPEIIRIRRIRAWDFFLTGAKSLKILTADEIKLTDNGIELINRPFLLPKTQPLPEIRRF